MLFRAAAKRKGLALALILAWALVVLGGYYYLHKPIQAQAALPAASAALDLLLALLIVTLAGALGRLLLCRVDLSLLSPVEATVLQCAAGTGALSFFWLAAGLFHLYAPWLAWMALAAGLALLHREALGWLRGFAGLRALFDGAGKIKKALAALSAFLLFGQLLIALAPPTRWDALADHLEIPRRFIEAGGLVFLPDNPMWGHPKTAEMLYTFAMLLKGPETAAVLGWAYAVVLLLGAAACAQRAAAMAGLSGSAAAWGSVSALLCGYTFRYMTAWAYSDLFSAFFGLAAFMALLPWLASRQPRWFYLACLFAGLAIGVKWTSGVFALGLVLFATFQVISKKMPLRGLLLGGLVVAAVTLPWLLKNALFTGSPVYPYLVPTRWVGESRMHASTVAAPTPADVWQSLLLPFWVTWAGIESAPGFGSDVGPLLLLLAVFGFFWDRQARFTRSYLLILLPAALALGAASLFLPILRQPRLYFVMLPGLAVVAGMGWGYLQPIVLAGVRLRRIVGALVALVMLLAALQDAAWQAEYQPARVVFDAGQRDAYLFDSLGYHYAAMRALRELPEGARVLMLWEPRGLYAPSFAQPDAWIDRWRADLNERGSAQAVLDGWRDEGYTHLLVYEPGTAFIRPEDGGPTPAWSSYQDLLALLPAPEDFGGQYSLYRIR